MSITDDIVFSLVVTFIIACNILFLLDIECKNNYPAFNYIARISNLIIYSLLLLYLLMKPKNATVIIILIVTVIILIGNIIALIRQDNCEDNNMILVFEKISIILAIILIMIFTISFWLNLNRKSKKILPLFHSNNKP